MSDLTDLPEQGSVDNTDAEIANTISQAVEAEADAGPEEVETPESDSNPEPDQDETPEGEQADDEVALDEETETQTPDPESDPRDAQIAALTKRQDDLLSMVRSLVEAKQVQAPKPEVRNPVPDVSEEAVRLALFSGDETRWKALTERERAEALKVQQAYVDREVKAALNPKFRYDQMKDDFLRDVAEFMQPVLQEHHNQQAAKIVGRHLDPIKDPSVRKRAEALFQESPGSKSSNWSDLDKALGMSAKLALAEARDRKIAEQQQKVQGRKVQNDAAKPKPKTPGKGPGEAKPKGNPLLMGENESPAEMFNRLLGPKVK